MGSEREEDRAMESPRSQLNPDSAEWLTPMELIVAETWRAVLGLEAVGANDNFFDLGGHSLLAAQIVAALRESLSVDLQLRSIFESPTIAALAYEIQEIVAGNEPYDVGDIPG